MGMIRQYDEVIDINLFNQIEIILEWHKDELYCIPYFWKVLPPLKGYQAKYFGLAWSLAISWIGFRFGITRLA